MMVVGLDALSLWFESLSPMRFFKGVANVYTDVNSAILGHLENVNSGKNIPNKPQNKEENYLIPQWFSQLVIYINCILIAGFITIYYLKEKFSFLDKIYNYFCPKFSMSSLERELEQLSNETSTLMDKLIESTEKNKAAIEVASKTSKEYCNRYLQSIPRLKESLPTLKWNFIENLIPNKNDYIKTFKMITNLKLKLMIEQLDYSYQITELCLTQNHATISHYLGSKETMNSRLSSSHEETIAQLTAYSVDIENTLKSFKNITKKLLEIEKNFNSRIDMIGEDGFDKSAALSTKYLIDECYKIPGLSDKMESDLKELGKVYEQSVEELNKTIDSVLKSKHIELTEGVHEFKRSSPSMFSERGVGLKMVREEVEFKEVEFAEVSEENEAEQDQIMGSFGS